MISFDEIKTVDGFKTDYCLDGEIWEFVPDYEDHYQVSNFGRVRSLGRIRLQMHSSGKMVERFYKGQIIAPDISCHEFGGLVLYKGKKKVKTIAIYRLVCQCFGQEYADNFYYGEHTPLNLPNEIWKDVVGYEGLYKVSNLGRVKKPMTDYEIVLKPFIGNSGYEFVTLSINNKAVNYLVHRLVAIAFLDNFDISKDVNHIDGIKTNNAVTNLEWVTKSENMKHAYNHGLITVDIESKKRCAKLGSDMISVSVYCRELDHTFNSMLEASKQLNIEYSKITYASLHNKSVNWYTFERR